MAGTLRPSAEIIEGTWLVNESTLPYGDGKTKLFNGVRGQWWNSVNSATWSNSGHYIDITLNQNSRIWILPCGNDNYLGSNGALSVYEWNETNNSFDFLYNTSARTKENKWEAMIELSKGRYKFGYGGVGRLDDEWFIELLSYEKNFIKKNSVYLYYDLTIGEWVEIGEEVSEQDYLNYGMDNLSIIPQSAWQELNGTIEIKYYTDEEQKEQSILQVNKEPFSVYDYISETPTVVVYTVSTDDITVSTTTEPFTLYDEFGDEVEVLYYTDDESVTEAALTIEANWSPLDELQGEVEVVTWSSDAEAQLQLETEGLFKEQIVKLQAYIDVSNLVSVNIAAGTEHAKFLIEKRSEPGMYYSLYEGHFFECESSEHMIGNYGLTPATINAITKAQWQAFLGSETHIKLLYLFSNQSIATKSVSATLDVEHTVGTITVVREIIATTPNVSTLELTVNMFSPEGRLEEIERINLNNLMELELRTSILMKMPIIKSKQMIIETFDDNDYEIVSAGSKYNIVKKQFENEFKLILPIEIPSDAGTVIFNSLGQGFSAELTDGTTTKAITFDYSETIDLSSFSKNLLSLNVKGNTGGWIKGVAYAWS